MSFGIDTTDVELENGEYIEIELDGRVGIVWGYDPKRSAWVQIGSFRLPGEGTR